MTGPSTRWYKVSFRGGPGFFSGKPAGGRTPEPAHTMREPRAPGARLGAGLKTCGGPNPRGRGPLCIVGFYDNGGEVLLKREPTGSLGSGGTPAAFLLSFVAEDKRKWPAGQTYSIKHDFLCTHAAIKHRLCFGTPFLSAKKGEKEASGGKAP